MWQDAYYFRTDGRRVHLIASQTDSEALCGMKVKPWTRPDPFSNVHQRCVDKAHKRHRELLKRQKEKRERKGLTPGPDQASIDDA